MCFAYLFSTFCANHAGYTSCKRASRYDGVSPARQVRTRVGGNTRAIGAADKTADAAARRILSLTARRTVSAGLPDRKERVRTIEGYPVDTINFSHYAVRHHVEASKVI